MRGEFIELVEWPDDARGACVWRFPRGGNAIKADAMLIVREGEAAVLVDGGRVADVFGPGAYALETKTLPVLSRLQGRGRDSNAPFEAEVYFVAKRRFTGVSWRTDGPVRVRDREFGTVRLDAAGVCEVRVADAAKLLREFPGEDVEGLLGERVGAAFASAVVASGVPVPDMAADRERLGERLRRPVARRLGSAGLDLASLTVEDLGLPPGVAAAARARGGGRGEAPAAFGAAEWYLGLDGHQVGPFGVEELRDRAASGELTPQTLVWRSGLTAWAAAGEVPELADVMASAQR